MNDHDRSGRKPPRGRSFWRSRTGFVLLAFLAAGGLLLAFEHRAHLVTSPGLLVVGVLVMVALHVFMHSGHGSNGGWEHE